MYAIQAVHADLPAFAAAERHRRRPAEADARLRQLAEPLPERGLRIAPALIPQTGSTEPRGHCRSALAHVVAAHQVVHHFPLPDGLYHFF